MGSKVRSVTAGLPLIVLGMIAVVLAMASWRPSVPPDGPPPDGPEKNVQELLTAWKHRMRRGEGGCGGAPNYSVGLYTPALNSSALAGLVSDRSIL
jgi:hypothetical protein